VATPGERSPDGHGKNTAYLIHIDDLTVCHLGDLGRTLNSDQISALKDPDVLLIPAGGECTISPAEASEVVSQLEPKLVIPMHYALAGVQVKLGELDRFCREMGVQDVRPQAKLSVTRSGLPEEATVVVLETASVKR
jgi:L-ascorbate metabolism protein UlaG (beta-lactamase superfamily)